MSDFKGRHFEGEIVLWAVRWYCHYSVSYRDLARLYAQKVRDHERAWQRQQPNSTAGQPPTSTAEAKLRSQPLAVKVPTYFCSLLDKVSYNSSRKLMRELLMKMFIPYRTRCLKGFRPRSRGHWPWFIASLAVLASLLSNGTARAQAVTFANLQIPVGIEADRAGNLYVDSDATFTTWISKLAPSGALLGRTTLGGITRGNLGHIARLPGSDNMMLLTNRGAIYLFGPGLQLTPYLSLASLNFATANGVYDITTNRFRSLVLGAPSWGDIAAFWPRADLLYLYITATTGAAGGFPFVLRLELDFRLNQVFWRVVTTSTGTTAGTVNQPRGIAVNSLGWVLTGLPFLIPNRGFGDSLVAFRTTFPQVQTAATLPRFVLRTNRTLSGLFDLPSFGMASDAGGSFYIASGVVGSSLCGVGGSGALVLINPVPTTPNPRCIVLPAILGRSVDVAVSPVGNIPYMTVGNRVLRFNRLLNVASQLAAQATTSQMATASAPALFSVQQNGMQAR